MQENKAALINVALMLNKVKACDEREGLLLVNASYVSEEFGLVLKHTQQIPLSKQASCDYPTGAENL